LGGHQILITDGRTGVTLNAPPPFFEWRGHKNYSNDNRCKVTYQQIHQRYRHGYHEKSDDDVRVDREWMVIGLNKCVNIADLSQGHGQHCQWEEIFFTETGLEGKMLNIRADVKVLLSVSLDKDM